MVFAALLPVYSDQIVRDFHPIPFQPHDEALKKYNLFIPLLSLNVKETGYTEK